MTPNTHIPLPARSGAGRLYGVCIALAGSMVVLVAAVAVGSASSTLTWRENASFRTAPLTVPDAGRVGFVRLDPAVTGVHFTNQLDDADLAKNQILEIGSGVALGDVDGDGYADVYFCSMHGANRLYRNLGGWRFEDLTESAGVACPGQFSTGAVLADVDGDGDLDLLVNGVGSGTRLFRNQGGFRFDEITASGLERGHGSTSMALADIDGDGDLDLYVAHYNTRTLKDSLAGMEIEAGYVDGKFVVNPPGLFLPLFTRSGGVSLFERGEADRLYLNDQGHFAPVAWTNGTFLDALGQPLAEEPKEWGLTATFRDLNGDRAPDLYVCNDFCHSRDQVWLNDGHGRFHPLPPLALRPSCMSSMTLDFADIDRDGADDLLVLDMLSRSHELRHRQRASQIHLQVETPIRDPAFRPEYPRNMLFWNRGDGTYAEIAQSNGLEASEWSWSVAFLDVDLDGYEDVLIANGTVRDANDADRSRGGGGRMDGRGSLRRGNLRFPPLETANLAFRNHGDLTFEECGQAWGFDTIGVSHGMALADLDNDGDLDVVVNQMRAPAGLYRNDTAAPRVAVRALGQTPNVQGIGAKIELRHGAVPYQSQEIASGGRYLSGDDPVRVFAAGTARTGMTLTVTWRNRSQTVVSNVLANHLYEIREPASGSRANPGAPIDPPPNPVNDVPSRLAPTPPPPPNPMFEDVSSRLRQPHREEEFNDFERQPTLPRQLSRLGPGATWRDLDGDGWEDLVISGARKGFSLVYLNDRQGGFHPTRRREPLGRDQTTLLAVTRPDRSLELLAGSSNYEDPENGGSTVARYDLQTGGESEAVGPQPWSVGPLALGTLGHCQALFVGARVRPGRYPEPAGSQLYLRENESWRLDPTRTAALTTTGLANGAVWADLDADGEPELVVACDWGPIRVYTPRDRTLHEITSALQLDQRLGWWNGIAAGDFDEDGRLDLIASNWGRNTKYQRHRLRPLRLYYGDWQGRHQLEALEAYWEPVRQAYVPFLPLDLLRNACPGLAEKYATFAAYATATIEDITGLKTDDLTFLEANWLETTLFLNRGDHFETQPLPTAAQLAPAFGVSIGDLDGDGHEDVFLSQNFFDVDPETSRYDAGRGLLLLGDGNGNLTAVPGQQSGIRLYGEQRGSALADFDRDGRVDLVVGQNDGPVGLFRNVLAEPGLRIRLAGPTWNRDGVGATIRLQYGDRLGPARCVTIGSGFWSQESLVQVIGHVAQATGIWVRWPGGTVTRKSVRSGEAEVLVVCPGD